MTKKNIQCNIASSRRMKALRAQGRRGLWDIAGMTMSPARGGRQHCGPGDSAGRWCRRLGNGVGCTASRAQEGRWRCRLKNGVAGLGMAPAWSMESLAWVGEDGSM
jgi:hypothetical protein